MSEQPVTYGMEAPTGYGWGRASRMARATRLHLVSYEAWNTKAVCGKDVGGSPSEYASGTLCPDCADALEVDATKLPIDSRAADFFYSVEVTEQ